jgi:hypothetical protein
MLLSSAEGKNSALTVIQRSRQAFTSRGSVPLDPGRRSPKAGRRGRSGRSRSAPHAAHRSPGRRARARGWCRAAAAPGRSRSAAGSEVVWFFWTAPIANLRDPRSQSSSASPLRKPQLPEGCPQAPCRLAIGLLIHLLGLELSLQLLNLRAVLPLAAASTAVQLDASGEPVATFTSWGQEVAQVTVLRSFPFSASSGCPPARCWPPANPASLTR